MKEEMKKKKEEEGGRRNDECDENRASEEGLFVVFCRFQTKKVHSYTPCTVAAHVLCIMHKHSNLVRITHHTMPCSSTPMLMRTPHPLHATHRPAILIRHKTNKTHLVPLALLAPGVGSGAACAHRICVCWLWRVWEGIMESAVWYWDAGHGKRREEMICVCGGYWVMG